LDESSWNDVSLVLLKLVYWSYYHVLAACINLC